jgi:hypothetical protein
MSKTLLFALLLACALPARAADPVIMFLLGVAREMAASAAIKAVARSAAEPEVVALYPGTTVQPEHLRQLINDSFLYLTEAQRAQVFEALHEQLMKPEIAAIRAPMIEYFSVHALQVRAAQIRLAQLSEREKQRLADTLRNDARTLSPEQVDELRDALVRNLLPVPADLNRMLLAALRAD